MTRRRRMLPPLLGLAAVLVVVGAAYFAWLGLAVRGDLQAARAAGERLRAALGDADPTARDAALADLQAAAASAHDRTDDPRWALVTWLPVFGDDAVAVESTSRSLDTVASRGLPPLVRVVDSLDQVSGGGRIDLDALARLRRPVAQARGAFVEADRELAEINPPSYISAVQGPVAQYQTLVSDGRSGLESARTALRVLPTMLGGEGPRDYLLVFQNNAEIRGTGGLPGAWALVHADDGRLDMMRQGSANDFPVRGTPVLPLSAAEREVYGEQLGVYFHDANFTPDFPRAAQLWTARFEERFPATDLDGVVSLDTVTLSYLLEGTGPVTVEGRQLTADNALPELLDRPYRELDPQAQDAYFQEVARAVFKAATGELADPVAFFQGLATSASEDRFLVSSEHAKEQRALDGTAVEGELRRESGATPYVDISLNDTTGSKMSYYLRTDAEVTSMSCEGGAQTLQGRVTLQQTIGPADAAALPDSVTGGGQFGVKPGDQMVFVRVHGPPGAKFREIRIDGKRLPPIPTFPLDGRPVISLVLLLSSTGPIEAEWVMETASGQTRDGVLGLNPSVVPGDNDTTFPTSC